MRKTRPLILSKAAVAAPLPPLTKDNDSSGSDPIESRRLKFGMWLFLATETLIFGGFFVIYFWSRVYQTEGFALGSQHMETKVGLINTVILLTSSLAMAIAVMEAQRLAKVRVLISLAVVWCLGVLFLGLKLIEYKNHYDEGLFPGLHFTYTGPLTNQLYAFMSLYFLGTGLHAVHMIIGLGLVSTLALKQLRQTDVKDTSEIFGLYWHFIDIVWVFLLPAFYLIGPRG